MAENTKKLFNLRAFVSVLAGLSFIVMSATGLVLFFAPSCRIARDTSWSVLGFDKDQWVGVHVWFSLAFVVASIFHVYFNWAALLSYFKSKLRKGFTLRLEWVAALLLCGLVYAGTIFEVTPFSSLMAWKETFKREGAGRGYGRGRQVMALQYIAEPGMSDQSQIGCKEEEQTHAPIRESGRAGMGQKTLKQFCDEESIDLSSAISRLKSGGYTAQETMTMREIAASQGVHPRELRGILQAEQ